MPKRMRAGLDTVAAKDLLTIPAGDRLWKSSGGRPSEIRDEQLKASDTVLVGCLEPYWHDVSWELSTGKTPGETGRALAEFFRRHQSMYRFPCTEETGRPTKAVHPRVTRHHYQQASLDLESIQATYDQDAQRVTLARRAASLAETGRHRREFSMS